MRPPVILLGRFCARPVCYRIPTLRNVNIQSTRLYTALRSHPPATSSTSGTGKFHSSRKALRAAAGGGAALGTAAFVKLSEKEKPEAEQTTEGRMLEISREELKKKVDDNATGFSRLRYKVVLLLDLYIWEPLWTGIRFLNLVVIFVPVMLFVPAIWVGRRQPGRDNERSGTLWWYGFLVKSMELSGPAFIKVREPNELFCLLNWPLKLTYPLRIARSMGSF